jgi:hypothetical protein
LETWTKSRMTQAAQKLLATFESLEPSERHQVAVEILRRSAPAGEISGEAFDELAAELFSGYEEEEDRAGL